jgi:flavorubredoxin
MKVLIAYDSYFLNTTLIAETIAEVVEKCDASVHLERIYQVDFSDISKYDLVIIGAPTHNQNMPRPVKSVLKRLPKDALRGIKTLCFDTRYKMNAKKSGSAARRIDNLLKRFGGETILPPVSFFVQDRRGPLFPGEIERARELAEVLMNIS